MGLQGPAGASGLNFQGAYGALTTYALDDVVTYAGSSFVSLGPGNKGNTPGVTSQWAVLAQGGTGASGGVGVAYQGTYASTANYALNDIVSFGGSSYISLISANHGNTPSASPAQWGVMALGALGAQGPQGLPGVTGLQGLTGPPGPTGPAGPTGATGAAGAAGKPGLVYQGNYSSVTNYALGDVVFSQGASYASLIASNHGNTPDQSPGQWGCANGSRAGVGRRERRGRREGHVRRGCRDQLGLDGRRGRRERKGFLGGGSAGVVRSGEGRRDISGPIGPQGVAGPVGMTFQGTYSSTVNCAMAMG